MDEGDRRGHHPSPAELDRFLLGEMSPPQAAPVLAHLLHGCAECQRKLKPLASVMLEAPARLSNPSAEPSGDEYDFPLFKAFAAARRYAAAQATAEERQTSAAPALKEAVPPKPAAPQTSSADAMERDWARCEWLIERCRSLRHVDLESMVLTASLAVVLAERLQPASSGPTALADLQAYALAELGNSQRIVDDVAGAETTLSAAVDRAGQGTGDPRLLAYLMDLTASLYTDLRRYEEALQLRDAVYAIYAKAGDRHLMGSALISKGFSLINALRAEEGIPFLTQGLTMVDAARDPRLVMTGIFNLTWSLVECGQAAQAESLFRFSQGFFSSYIERIDAIKGVWLEGRIAAALGEEERAERRFREALASYEEVRLPGYVAMVSIDLAILWLRAGRNAEITPLIEETIATFRAFGIQREVIGTLLVIHETIKKSQATEAFLRTAGAELLRSLGHKEPVLG
jgi:tetratricopeptide (TPR) repeat protein